MLRSPIKASRQLIELIVINL
nr:unnamed protein product [Callosobruchus chinensis]